MEIVELGAVHLQGQVGEGFLGRDAENALFERTFERFQANGVAVSPAVEVGSDAGLLKVVKVAGPGIGQDFGGRAGRGLAADEEVHQAGVGLGEGTSALPAAE